MATTTLNGTRRNVWIPGEWRLNGSRWRRSLHETGSTTPGSRKRRVASPLIGCRGTCFAVAMARSCQDIYANRGSSRLSFRLYALRFSWRICIRWIDSLSLSFPLSRTPFYFYLLLATYTCEYVYMYMYIYEPPRNARQYRPICIRDASLQPLSNFPFLSLSPSLSFSPRANQPLSGRAFLSSLALSILFNRVETRKGSTVERDRLFA